MSDDKPVPDTPQDQGHESEIPAAGGPPQDIPPWTPAAGNRQQAFGRFSNISNLSRRTFAGKGECWVGSLECRAR